MNATTYRAHRTEAETIMRSRRDPRPVTTGHVIARIILAGLPKENADVARRRRAELETWSYRARSAT